jgi:hypothetical protein
MLTHIKSHLWRGLAALSLISVLAACAAPDENVDNLPPGLPAPTNQPTPMPIADAPQPGWPEPTNQPTPLPLASISQPPAPDKPDPEWPGPGPIPEPTEPLDPGPGPKPTQQPDLPPFDEGVTPTFEPPIWLPKPTNQPTPLPIIEGSTDPATLKLVNTARANAQVVTNAGTQADLRPTQSVTLLFSAGADGRPAFYGVGGTIEGQRNPSLQFQQGTVVEILLVSANKGEISFSIPDLGIEAVRLAKAGDAVRIILHLEQAGQFEYHAGLNAQTQTTVSGILIVR